MKKLNKILIPIAIVIAGLFIAGAVIYSTQDGFEFTSKKTEVLSSQEVAEKAISYINNNLLTGGTTATLLSVDEEGGLYKVRLKVGEREYNSYATKDGRFFFPEGFDLTAQSQTPGQTQGGTATTQGVSKSDKPDVKLFVMSYCPFGLQAQKMFLPVYNLLKDKAEMGVYFVNYIMHEKKEIDENLIQYCIQKEEKDKYYTYLNCFVKDGNSEKCLNEANIDKNKLNTCISETDQEYKVTQNYNDENSWLNGRFPKFDVHSDLNVEYGVQGSPTVVINNQQVEVSPRSPEKFKEVICQAFNSPPAECSQTLSNSAFNPGFGEGTNPSTGGGGCGQ